MEKARHRRAFFILGRMLSFALIRSLMSSGYCLYTRGSLAWMRLSLFTFSHRGPVPFVGPAGAGGRRNGSSRPSLRCGRSGAPSSDRSCFRPSVTGPRWAWPPETEVWK